MDLKTPLYDCHTAAGGRMVPFAGYLLPVQYSGVVAEHRAVREAAGLFDVSHMGELWVAGPDALNFLNASLTNDFTSLKPGRVRYSPLCREDGGILDDLLVYRAAPDRFLAVVNAANRRKDADWLRLRLPSGAVLEDRSGETAQVALQGPASRAILSRLADPAALPEANYSFSESVSVAGVGCLVSRTGYTGEFGYELYCRNQDAPALWNALLEAGKPDGLIPCGLGARDTLRLEAAMPLYGHEMDETVSPYETGLGAFVKMSKPDFCGKAALAARGEPRFVRAGLQITGRGIAREGCPVLDGEAVVGRVTSGTHLPTLDGPYAMAFLPVSLAEPGRDVAVEVRGRRLTARVVPLPFYKSRS